MEKEPESRIEKLKTNLYSRRPKIAGVHARMRSGRPSEINTGWKHQEESEKIPLTHDIDHRKEFMLKRFVTISIIFFIAACALALYVFYGGTNLVSSSNVDIGVSGPVSIAAGDELALQVHITNNNRTPLKEATLLIEFPEGTKNPAKPEDDIRRTEIPLETIASGEKVTKLVRAALFGEENSVKEIKITVEYKVEGSNAIFFKDKQYEITLTSAPISISVTSSGEANSNQEVELLLDVTSNSTTLLSNILVQGEFPFGFTFKRSDPAPAYDNDTWRLGDLAPRESRKIKIIGTLSGQSDEERVFRFYSASQKAPDEKTLGAVLATSFETLRVRSPFIGLALSINGKNAAEYTSERAAPIQGVIQWTNNTNTEIRDVAIKAVFDGNSIDEASVSSEGGFYRSSDNTLIWDKSTAPHLATIGPGAKGSFSFSFKSLGISATTVIKNPVIIINAQATGFRIVESTQTAQVSTSLSRSIKIATNLFLNSQIFHNSGPFQNTGPIPPKAEQETTYTITWSLANSANNLENVKVTAALPSYARWTNLKDPTGEKISYNASNRVVTWDVGSLPGAAGYDTPARAASFQVAFLPSISQIGQTPAIIGDTTAQGQDVFSKTTVTAIRRAQSANLQNDANFILDSDKVVQ